MSEGIPPTPAAHDQPKVLFACGAGCCPGCMDCYGMQIGCHQNPCRCELPCTCDWSKADEDAGWQSGCERHDSTDDRRHGDDSIPEDDLPGWCPVCLTPGPCSEDDEGRPLFHSGAS